MDKIIQLKISLRDTKPPIWRRILIESTRSFEELHEVIQLTMGWTDSHLHEFTLPGARQPGIRIGVPFPQFEAEFGGDELLDERTVTLESVLTRKQQRIEYLYDFGDSWEHTLLVENFLPMDEGTTYPLCIGGELRCPPEDCGGIHGFYQMLAIVNNKRHPEREEWLEWLGRTYDPLKFDIHSVNKKVASKLKTHKRNPKTEPEWMDTTPRIGFVDDSSERRKQVIEQINSAEDFLVITVQKRNKLGKQPIAMHTSRQNKIGPALLTLICQDVDFCEALGEMVDEARRRRLGYPPTNLFP